MRLALGLILIFACITLLVLSTFVFHEIPYEDRKKYYSLKYNLKQHKDIETHLKNEIEEMTLSNYDEWLKMRYQLPNVGDLRAVGYLNFLTALMYSLPVTLVGLILISLNAELTQISISFLLATVMSLIASIIALFAISYGKKEPKILFALGMTFALASAFFMQDYQNTNTT